MFNSIVAKAFTNFDIHVTLFRMLKQKLMIPYVYHSYFL